MGLFAVMILPIVEGGEKSIEGSAEASPAPSNVRYLMTLPHQI